MMEAAVLARQSPWARLVFQPSMQVFAGVSGGFTLGTGIATNDNSGAVAIWCGLPESGTGEDISFTVGSGNTAGGSFILTGLVNRAIAA